MKKILLVILALVFFCGLFAGCNAKKENKEQILNVIRPLPQTLDINALENCTVAVSLDKGDVFVDEDGKIKMSATVYSYELYDMVDISTLKENDIIVRRNEEIKVSEIKRLDSGLVNINGGEENGGFDLISNDSTVYYETGMNDIKAYYELGSITLPVSQDFKYIDESDLSKEAKKYFAGDFLKEDEIKYEFSPNNTKIIIENGTVIKMNKVYMP